MYTYRLVYVLATQNGPGWDLLVDQEFQNRAAAKDYIDLNKDDFSADVYILRKEVSFFYDQKVFDKSAV